MAQVFCDLPPKLPTLLKLDSADRLAQLVVWRLVPLLEFLLDSVRGTWFSLGDGEMDLWLFVGLLPRSST